MKTKGTPKFRKWMEETGKGKGGISEERISEEREGEE